MTPNSFLSLLLLSLIPPSCALTEYIGDNVTIVATSVQPCHLFGDSDLLGVGVRASFYISWAVGLLGVLLGALEEMKAPRLSFNILLLTLTIILIRNTSRGSLALLEWYTVMGLAVVSINALFMAPMQTYGLAIEDESESHSQPSGNSSRHPSPSRNNDAAERRESIQSEDRTNNQEQAANGGTQPSLKENRDLADEQTRRDAEVRVKRLHLLGFYSDPLGFGSLVLLYGVIGCCLPWLYFIEPTSGRREGCAVPIVLFGTWDMFNKHWQRFLKFAAVMGVLFGALSILLGFYMVYRGIKMRKTYALTLELMKEGRYREVKLLSLDVGNLKRALNEAETGTVPEAQMAIQQLVETHQWARRREEAAAAGEMQARDLLKRASELQEQYRVQHILSWVARGVIFVVSAVPGSLSIWFIETTIDKNQLDMDDDLGSSNGQLLALLVAVLTTINFLWEVFKSKFEERKARKDTEKMVNNIFDDARSLQLHAGRQKAIWKSMADKASSALRHYLSTVAPSSSSAATEARRGKSVLGFKFRTWPRGRGGDSEV